MIYTTKVALVIILLLPLQLSAEQLSPEVQAAVDEAAQKASVEAAEKAAEAAIEKQSQRKFAGIDFGVGISATVDYGANDRVKDAEIIDGIVRVTADNNVNARVMLELHYFFTPGMDMDKENDEISPLTGASDFGWGPFVALQPGTDEIIEAIGLGIMVGWKRKSSASSSWNLGFGVVVDPNVKILGDGFEENQPPPGNETQVRFKETDQWGLLILGSYSF